MSRCCCSAALLPESVDSGAVAVMNREVDPQAGADQLAAAAAAAHSSGAALAARQAEALHSVRQELLCSPEIVRCCPIQGMASRCIEHCMNQQTMDHMTDLGDGFVDDSTGHLDPRSVLTATEMLAPVEY